MKKYVVVPFSVEKRVEEGDDVYMTIRSLEVLVREKDLDDFLWFISKHEEERVAKGQKTTD